MSCLVVLNIYFIPEESAFEWWKLLIKEMCHGMSKGVLTIYPAFSCLILLRAGSWDRSTGIRVGRFQNTYIKALGMSWEESSKSVKEKAAFMLLKSEEYRIKYVIKVRKWENCNTCGLKTKYRQISSFALLGMSSVTAVEERLSIWHTNEWVSVRLPTT